MKIAPTIALALILGGCAMTPMTVPVAAPAPEPPPAPPPPPPPPRVEVRTVQVKVPVPQPCKAKVPPRPRYADEAQGADVSAFALVEALRTGIAQRSAREKQLEAALRSCGAELP